MHLTKRILSGCLSAALLLLGLSGGALAAGRGRQDFTLGIYSTTDMRGKCYHTDPITGKAVEDSLLKVATAMTAERAGNDATILIDNGGIAQGFPLLSYNMNGEGGVDDPTALALRYIGYDAFVPGDHAFNYDQTLQQRFYDLLQDDTGAYPGTPVPVLCANYIDAETQQPKLEPYKTVTFQVDGQDFKVGVLGFENVDLSNRDLPSRYEGADFVHAGNDQRSLAYEWVNHWQKTLRETEGCDLVIVAAHSGAGGEAQETAGQTSAALRPEDQVAHLIGNTTGIDLVIAGQDRVPGVSQLKNADGKAVAVVSGGGASLTKTVVRIGRDGSFTVGQSEDLPLSRYEDDEGLKALMEPYYQRALPFVEQEIGALSGGWDTVADLFHAQSDTMDLLHEAQLWATGADLSIASPAADKGFYIGQLLEGRETGSISLKDCYSLYKHDDHLLYTVEMTGRQIKGWLEECMKDYAVSPSGAITGGGSGTDQIYGVSYDVYLGNPEGVRVANLTYKGKPVTDNQTFQVAVSSHRLSANADGDPYGWYAATGITLESSKVLWEAPRSEAFAPLGGSVTLIVAEYIRSLTAQGKEVAPPEARSRWTMSTSTSMEALAKVTRLAFVERLYQAVGATGDPNGAPFADVGPNAAVSWAAFHGIVNGNGEGLFLPDGVVTREQAVVMLMKLDVALGRGPSGVWAVPVPYADAAVAAAWTSDAMMWNVIRGYLIPDTAGNFRPQDGLTAADLDAALIRFLGGG